MLEMVARQVLEPAVEMPSGTPQPHEELCTMHLRAEAGAPWHAGGGAHALMYACVLCAHPAAWGNVKAVRQIGLIAPHQKECTASREGSNPGTHDSLPATVPKPFTRQAIVSALDGGCDGSAAVGMVSPPPAREREYPREPPPLSCEGGRASSLGTAMVSAAGRAIVSAHGAIVSAPPTSDGSVSRWLEPMP